MCRNITPLFNFAPPATPHSGMNKPSEANRVAFEAAVREVEEATQRMLAQLTTSAPPKNREAEAAKRRVRNAARFGVPTSADLDPA